MPNDLGFQSFDEVQSLVSSTEGANRGYQSFDELVALSSPKIGAGERARLRVEQETGEKAEGGWDTARGVLESVTGANVGRKIDAQKREAELGRLTEASDDEINSFIGTSGLSKWAKSLKPEDAAAIDQIVKTTDDPQVRAAAVRKVANDTLAGMTERKKAASERLETGFQPWHSRAVSYTVENAGYMLPFAGGGKIAAAGKLTGLAKHATKAALPLLRSGVATYKDLTADTYDVDDEGNVFVASEGDSGGKAALKAAANAGREVAIEMAGGEALGWVFGKFGGRLMTGNMKNAMRSAVRRMNDTDAGRAVLGAAHAYQKLTGYTQFQGFIPEMFEEELDLATGVFGLDKKDSENKGIREASAEYWGDAKKLETHAEIALGLLGTFALQGGVSTVQGLKAEKSRTRAVDNALRMANVNDETIAGMNAKEKDYLYEVFIRREMEPEKAAKIMRRLGGRLSAAADEITEQEGYRFDADRDGIKPNFKIPSGIADDGQVHIDPASGIGLASAGDGRVTMYDPDGGKAEFASVGDAVEAAKQRSVELQVLGNRRANKMKFVGNAAQRLAGNLELDVFDSVTGLVQAHPELRENPNFDPRSPGVRMPGGKIALVLDNIRSPQDALRTIMHEAGVHEGLRKTLGSKEAVADFAKNVGGVTAEELEARSKKLGYRGDKALLVEEGLAHAYENRTADPSTYQDAVSWLRGHLRKVNPKLSYSDSEIEVLMWEAQQSVMGEGGAARRVEVDAGAMEAAGREVAEGYQRRDGERREAEEQSAYERKMMEIEESYTPKAPVSAQSTAVDLNAESQRRMAEDPQAWIESLRAAKGDIGKAVAVYDSVREDISMPRNATEREEIDNGTPFEAQNQQEWNPNVQFQGNKTLWRSILAEGMRQDGEGNPYASAEAADAVRKQRRAPAQPDDNRGMFSQSKQEEEAETAIRGVMRGDRLQRRMEQLSEQSKTHPEFKSIVSVKRAAAKIKAVLQNNWGDMSVEERRTLFDVRDSLTRENAGEVSDAVDMFVLDLKTRPVGSQPEPAAVVQEPLTPEKGTSSSEKERQVPVSEAAVQPPSPAPEVKTADVAQQTPTAKKAQEQESALPVEEDAQEAALEAVQATAAAPVPSQGPAPTKPAEAKQDAKAKPKVKPPPATPATPAKPTEADAKRERAEFDAAVKARFWATGTNRLRADKAKAVKDGEELKKIGGEFERMWLAEKAKADRMKAAGRVKALAEAVGMAEDDTGKNEGNTPVSAPRNALSDETASKDAVEGEKKHDNAQEVTAAEKEKYFGAKPSGPHENAIAANLAYMKSYRGEWEAMPINGMALVDDERGFKQEMPEYDFSEYQKEGYKDAPSLYASGNTGSDIACEWCSHPIKNVYWLVNKKRKWLMKCGSECIKDFGESTGLEIVKKVEQDKADDALRSLVRMRSGLSGAFRYTRDVGYGRTETTWGYGKGNDAAKLFDKIGKMLGQTDVKSDQAAKTRWWRKHGESITEIIQQAEALIASDEAKQSTARKARNAMGSFTAQLRRDSLAEYEKRQASKVLATLSGLHESLDAALVEAVSFTVPSGYKKTGGMYEFQSATPAVGASGASGTVQDSLKVGQEPATAQTKNRQSIDKVEPEWNPAQLKAFAIIAKQGGDAYNFAGPRNLSTRKGLLEAITGQKVLSAKAGVHELKARLEELSGKKHDEDIKSWLEDQVSREPPASPSSAVKVETEPDGDKTVSVPSKDKPSITPKEQKKFLLAEIDKAMEMAPDEAEESGNWSQAQEEEWKAAEKATDEARKYRDEIRRYGSEEWKSRDKAVTPLAERSLALSQKRNLEKYVMVSIEVPGDGEFTVINDKAHLSVFRDMAKKRFPASMFERADNKKKALPEPHAPVRLGRTVGFDAMTAEIKALLQPFASKDKDPKRKTILNPHWNGAAGEAVATDGRRLAVMIGKKNAKPKKDDSGYPNYAQVIPGYKEGNVPNPSPADALAVKVDSAKLARKLTQALSIYKDVDKADPTVKLWMTADGSLEVSTDVVDTGSYSSLREEGDGFLIGIYNPEYLMDALTFLRKTGNETPVMYASGRGSPMIMAGKSEYVVQMPLRLDSSGRANDTHVEDYAKWKAGQDGALDRKGRTPEQVESLKKMAAAVKAATANANTPAQAVRIIPYKDVPSSKIKNMEAMPRGTGARYLEVTEGENGDWVAKQWRRKPVTEGNRSALLDFDAPATAQAPGKLEDFGEKIGGARKDKASFAKSEMTDDDIAKNPFSEIWPKSNVDAIEDDGLAAIAHAIRDSVPSKPRQAFKLRRWVEQVKTVKTLMGHAQDMGRDEFLKKLSDNRVLAQLANKIKLLGMVKRENWGRIGKVEYYPEAYSYDKAGNQIKKPYASAEIDDNYRASAASVEELAESVNKRLEGDAPEKRMEFEIRGTPSKGYFINKKGDPLYRKLKTFTGTDQNEVIVQARKFVNEEYDALVRAWEDVKDSDNVKETDVRRDENRPRTGKDHRNGKSATTEMFMEAFGFRGVEFGNWVSQGKNMKERQGMLDASYDALMDLADIMGVPTRAISLNGSLGLGLGSRGHGWASAHFEASTLVINLTKTRGAGSLAHEFFHAMDNFFQRQRGTPSGSDRENYFITYNPESYYEHNATGQRLSQKRFASVRLNNPDDWKRIDGVRPEVEAAFVDLVKALNDSPMNKRAALIDKGKSGGYWSRIIERAARSFETYVIAKMQQKGYQNDYLANVVDVKEFSRDPGRYPYLLAEELAPVEKAFDGLFSTIQTKETDKGVAMFRRVTPEQDAEYMRAVEAGDMEKARRMVLSRAKRLGALTGDDNRALILNHGSRAKAIRVFDDNRLGSHTGANSAKRGHFFVDDERVAYTYMDSKNEAASWMRSGITGHPVERAEANLQRAIDMEARAVYDKDNDEKYPWIAKISTYDKWGVEHNYHVGEFDSEAEADEAANLEKQNQIREAEERLEEAKTKWQEKIDDYNRDRSIVKAVIFAQNPYYVDFNGAGYAERSFSRAIDDAEENGADVVVLQDVKDAADGSDIIADVYIVLKGGAHKIKSADAVTYDDAGNVIPLSERFNDASDDIRFRRVVTPDVVREFDRLTATLNLPKGTQAERQAALDKWIVGHPEEYAELEKLRADVLKAAGYNVGPVWHSSSEVFNVFRKRYERDGVSSAQEASSIGRFGKGIFFSSDPVVSEKFGGVKRKFYLKIDEPTEYDLGGASYYDGTLHDQETGEVLLDDDGEPMKVDKDMLPDEMAEIQLDDSGTRNTGVIVRGVYESIPSKGKPKPMADTYVVGNPSQIKLADPLTLDDNGALITPDRWADQESPDIRFRRVTPEQDAEYMAVVEAYTNKDGSKKAGWMLAPNGKPTKLQERQWLQVRTPSFKAWFGDWENNPAEASKVVDANGEPMVVYHGTSNAGFSSFRMPTDTRTGMGYILGHYFSRTPQTAATYSGIIKTVDRPGESEYDRPGQPRDRYAGIYPVFLNIRTPAKHDFNGREWNRYPDSRWAVGTWYGKQFMPYYKNDASPSVFDSESEALDFLKWAKRVNPEKPITIRQGETDTRRLALQALGTADGVIFREVIDTGGFDVFDENLVPQDTEPTPDDVFVVFSNNQIKSATANTGTFDAGNDDIRFRRSTVTPEQDAEYMAAVNRGDMEKARRMVDARLAEIGSYWHGTPSGDLRGGVTGLHIGTKQAAMEALEARIGIPADGKGWDGTREYGKTLLAGKNRIRTGQFGKHRETGYNAGEKGKPLPDEDFYPADYAIPTVGDGTKVDLSWKPWVRPVLIVGPMAIRKKTDSASNSSMRRLLRQGRAVEGFYYKNESEDYGSTSAVLPNGEYVRVKLADPATYDDNGDLIPLSRRFNDAQDDIRFRRVGIPVNGPRYFRALPSTDSKARDMQADVQISYAYNLTPATVQQMQDDARGVYEKDRKQAQLDLLDGRTDSGIVNTDARRMAIDKIAVDDMTMDAVNSPDDEGKAATAMLAIWRWYERGTDVARAMRLRFDPVDTPEGRRAWIMRTLLAPTRAEAEIISRAENTAAAINGLKRKAKLARAVMAKLKAKGRDVSKLTANQLMDDEIIADILRDISTARSGWGDVVHEWWRNAILSAPTTQIVNTIGNAGNAALEAFIQRPVEAIINTVAKNERAASFNSIRAMYRAITPSIRAANKNFLKAWATEKPVTGDSSKLDDTNTAIPGWFGKNVVRVPQRAMMATDEWFKTVFMAMLTADYATREFDRLVKSGKQKESNRERYLLAQINPRSSSYASAWGETLRWSFQQKPGHMAGAIMNWRNDPNFGFWLKFIFPFVKTPANIISSGLRKTPLNAVPYIYKAATGKYSSEDAMRLGAEQAVGLVFMSVLYAMMRGDDDDPLNRPRITGSRKAIAFSPKGMKEAEMKDYPPMSVRVGDRWVSYKRLEPFATMASTMVDALTVWDQAKAGRAEDIPATVFSSIRGNLADKTFLQGVGNLVSIMEGDELAMSRAVTGTLAGFNPNIVRSTVRAFDPYIRESRTQERGALKKFAAKLSYQAFPSASNAPEPKIGKDGQPVEREGGAAYNALVPFSVQAADKTTKADAMIKRFNERAPKDQRWWPASPEPSDVSFGKEKIRMTDAENAEYKRVAGKIAERRLAAVGFNYANPTERDRDRMKKIYEGARSAARDRMRPAVIRRWKAERAVEGKGE